MGVLIKIDGAKFDKKYVIDTVEIVPDCDHVYELVETKAPTCKDTGANTYTCSICGHTYTDAIPVTEHNYVDCFCSVCGKHDPNVPYTIDEYPVQDTLKGLYDLGGTAEATVANHASNPANTQTAVLQGAYEMADNYVTFSGATNSCRMLTYVPATLENKVTLVALFSVPDGYRNIIGNATATLGLSLFNDRILLYANGTTVDPRYPSSINSQNFAVLALTADENGCRVVRYSNGVLNTLVDYEGAVDGWTASSVPFIIGGSSTGANYKAARISLAAIHEGKLTDAQLESVCEFVKAYGEQKGLTIE